MLELLSLLVFETTSFYFCFLPYFSLFLAISMKIVYNMKSQAKFFILILLFPLLLNNVSAQYQIKSPYLANPSLAIGYVDSCAAFWLKAYDSTAFGFFTNIDKTGGHTGNEKNLQTESRDAYGFIRAYQLTGKELYLYKARQALAFMYAHAWDNTNGGWYWQIDNNGNPTSGNTTKDAFHQHYALLGPTAMFEATRDTSHWTWAMKGYANNESKLWDARVGYEGYYNSAATNWSNKNGKSFNSTVDAITTHLLHFYLMTGNSAYLSKMVAVADNMTNRLVASMPSQKIGFCEGYDANWVPLSTDTMTIMGHILKTAWCFCRVNEYSPDTNYIFNAKKLFNHVYNKGYDKQLGGPYKDFSRNSGAMLMWGISDTAKAWWQMEQAVTAGLFMYKATGDQLYLQVADETLNFFMKYFVDHTYGEVYQDRTRYGNIIASWGEWKGNGNKAGYHSIELGYYTYLYGSFFVNKQPFTLYYNFAPSTSERTISLTPIETASNKYHIKDVTHNDVTCADFNSAARTVHVLANDYGKFKVTFELDNSTGIANDIKQIPRDFSLMQNYPNPFNPTTTIQYALPRNTQVSIRVYNALGKEVRELVNQEQPAGTHSTSFSGEGLSSGVYFYTIRAGEFTASRKMLLIK